MTQQQVQQDWLMAQLQSLHSNLRQGQQGLADWNQGKIAVSAVPGAGKSHSLVIAAAIAIAKHQLHSRRQLVIVTYTRSAAANIKSKIRDRLKELKLPPRGFVVQTLHGLALQIANSHKELSGLNLDNATIMVPNLGHRIIRSSVDQWINKHPQHYQSLLEGISFDGEETEKLRRQSVLRTEILPSLTNMAVREAKSSGLLPEDLWEWSQTTGDNYQVLMIAAGLYEQYQDLMRSRDFVDYDDMILAALKVLDYQPMRTMWQNQVFGVFEDEAQDSSPLQEKLIAILASDSSSKNVSPNLVRVGDPNQAINSTFTPANPIYFNWFCNECEQQGRLTTMNQAGRSSQAIINAANFVLDWVNQTTLNKLKQEQLPDELSDNPALPFRAQNIYPVPEDDPQPEANPDPEGKGLEIHIPEDIFDTVTQIECRAIARFLAKRLAHLPKDHNIGVYEVSESDRNSQIPQEILTFLQFLDRPHSPDNLKAALGVLTQRGLIPAQDLNALATYPEQFLYPSLLQDQQEESVSRARRYCCSLLRARIELPHYQLIPFLGMTLKYSGGELATVQKLSEKVNLQIAQYSSLKTTIEALEELVVSEKFSGVEEDTDDRYTRNNQITIITMHKAKGLDWDYVFLPFLHEDVLPGELWVPVAARFLGHFTLAEVARAQIRTLVHNTLLAENATEDQNYQQITIPNPIEAWAEAERLKQAEEFRLLYVAMTRAKRLLWISAAKRGPFRWSVFREDQPSKLQDKKPCPVLPALSKQFPTCLMR